MQASTIIIILNDMLNNTRLINHLQKNTNNIL